VLLVDDDQPAGEPVGIVLGADLDVDMVAIEMLSARP
jgi:hypothetical protein